MKCFVGFGFGPIQSALFLFEAYQSGNFSRYVVAEVDPVLVQAVRAAGGAYTINIARRDRIDQVTVRGVELYNPQESADRAKIVAAVAQADELATALPSVRFYDTGGQACVAAVLAEGLSRRAGGKPAVIYAAENHNHAAEILTEKIIEQASPNVLDNVQILNTVIGKMSGVISEPDALRRLGLAALTPGATRAVLVEEFNRILISRVKLAGFRRGIEVFVEKDDLLPFEEAKLYGHNAIHALIGYLADRKGLETMAQAGQNADIMATARAAFVAESGGALVRQYRHLGDPLFTEDGYRAYAEDLLDRMVRPNLNDLVSRVIRDPVRKLGYDDRLFGTMRRALRAGIEPVHLACGAAAAVLSLAAHGPDAGPAIPLPPPQTAWTEQAVTAALRSIWGAAADDQADHLVRLTWTALATLQS
jgi:mannitol-1-phosphate 5-dehydrogenase